jgi:hypothetical protein
LGYQGRRNQFNFSSQIRLMLSQFLSLYLMSQQPQPQQKDGLVFAGFISLVGGLFLWEKNRVGKSKEEVVIPPQPSSKTNSSVKTEATVQPTAEIDTPSIPTHSFKFSDDISELLSRIAREDGSTALCGDPGTGKSTITRVLVKR